MITPFITAAHAYCSELVGIKEMVITRRTAGSVTFTVKAQDYFQALAAVCKVLGKKYETHCTRNEQQALWYMSNDQSRRVHLRESYWGGYEISLIDLAAE